MSEMKKVSEKTAVNRCNALCVLPKRKTVYRTVCANCRECGSDANWPMQRQSTQIEPAVQRLQQQSRTSSSSGRQVQNKESQTGD